MKKISLYYLFLMYLYQIDVIPIILEMNGGQFFNELVLLLVPIFYVVYHAMKDEEKIPFFIKKISLVTLSILFIDETFYFVSYLSELVNAGDNYIINKIVPLVVSISIIFYLKRFPIKQKVTLLVAKYSVFTLIAVSFMLILMQLSNVNYIFPSNESSTFYFFINYMPIIYLMYLDVKEDEFESPLLNTMLISIVLLIILFIMYKLHIQYQINSSLIHENTLLINKVIIALNNIIDYVIVVITFNFVSRKVKAVIELENRKNPRYPQYISIGIAIYLCIKYINPIIGLDVITIIVHLLLGLIIVIYGFFIGVKKYNKTFQKLLLFLLPSFVILYVVYLISLVKDIYNETIFVVGNINNIFLAFSIFVIVYYTFETLLLFYAYDKQKYSSNEQEIVIEKDFHIYVMIPCLNEEVVIKNTLSSILASSYKNLSVYAIDDASTDNTAKIISSFDDSRLSLIRRVKPHAQEGKGEALNYVFEMIKEDVNNKGLKYEDTLIAIIDADTFIYPDYFHKINYVFNANRDITGLQSKVRVLSKTNDRSQDLEFTEIINATQALRMLTNTVAFGGNGQFCKLSTLDSLNEKPWSNSLVEDFDLSTRLFLAEGVHSKNVQFSDIFIEQTGIDKDLRALVKQRVRWAQGNVQSSKYILDIINSKKLELNQKFELLMTLIKPWLMAIEYIIVVYTIVGIIDSILLFGITHEIKMIIIIFILMSLYIALINLIWAILYNRNKNKTNIKMIFKDWFYLTLFLLSLTQIYPQSLIRFFKAENTWDKTNRQK